MSSYYYLSSTPGMNDTTHTETLPHGMLHEIPFMGLIMYATHFQILSSSSMVIIVNFMMELKLGLRDPTFLHFP
jgi:hypothetical protein